MKDHSLPGKGGVEDKTEVVVEVEVVEGAVVDVEVECVDEVVAVEVV